MKNTLQFLSILALMTSCTNVQQTEAAQAGCELAESYNTLTGDETDEHYFDYNALKTQINTFYIEADMFTFDEIKEFVKEECGEDAAETFEKAMHKE